MHDYLVFFDKRFLDQIIKELENLSSKSYRIESYLSDDVVVASMEVEWKELEADFSKNAVFIERILPIYARLKPEIDENFASELYTLLTKMVNGEAARLEVLKIGSKDTRNAKSIEVELGKRLEGMGIRMSMESPSHIVYLVLGNDCSYLSMLKFTDSYSSSLDKFRSRNIDAELTSNRINRAEFKIYEAFNQFNIRLPDNSIALDIGASPGGWSRFLLNRNAKVVAVDNGLIDYASMPEGTKIAIIKDKDAVLKDDQYQSMDIYNIEELPECIKDYGLVHFRKRFEDVKISSLKKLGPFSIACIDVNISAQESAVMAVVCAETLVENGLLLLTLKMTDDNIEKSIMKAKEALSEEYTNIIVKKLPHNRKELTLFAVKI